MGVHVRRDIETVVLFGLLVTVVCMAVMVGACSSGPNHSLVAPVGENRPLRRGVGLKWVTNTNKLAPQAMFTDDRRIQVLLRVRGDRFVSEVPVRHLAYAQQVVPASQQYGDQTALIGSTYGLDFSYQGLPASCQGLTWVFTTTIPNISPTYNPTVTTLTGTEEVEFPIPKNLPPGTIYTNTIQGICTNPSPQPSPLPTTYTTQMVDLDIVDVPQASSSPPTVVTNTTEPKIIGQYIALQASPQPAASLYTFYQVGNAGTPTPIASYTETTDQGYYINYNFGGLVWTGSLASFYYPEPYLYEWGLEANWYTLWCDGNWNSCFAGDQFAYTHIQVNAPTSVSVKATPGIILATPAPQDTCLPSLVFGIANQDSYSCNNGGSPGPGIVWVLTATGPAKTKSAQAYLGGALDMTQLITLTNSMTPLPGASDVLPVASPAAAALDSCIHYGMGNPPVHATVSPAAVATWTSNDSPGSSLSSTWLSYNRSDKFTSYFVYRLNDLPNTPTANENIWVVIGHANWSWSAAAVQATPAPSSGPAWSVTSAPAPEVSATTNNSHGSLPIWSTSYNTVNATCPPGG